MKTLSSAEPRNEMLATSPAIPWVRLPKVFELQSLPYHGNYFTAAARQLAGPIPLRDLSGSPPGAISSNARRVAAPCF